MWSSTLQLWALPPSRFWVEQNTVFPLRGTFCSRSVLYLFMTLTVVQAPCAISGNCSATLVSTRFGSDNFSKCLPFEGHPVNNSIQNLFKAPWKLKYSIRMVSNQFSTANWLPLTLGKRWSLPLYSEMGVLRVNGCGWGRRLRGADLSYKMLTNPSSPPVC